MQIINAKNNIADNRELGKAVGEAEEWAKESKGQYAGYALTYINAIPRAINYYGEKGLKVQLNYVLANLAGWRGDTARESKNIIQEYINS